MAIVVDPAPSHAFKGDTLCLLLVVDARARLLSSKKLF
jgi:hypothetical protein